MRALYLKELRQGLPLLLFGLGVAALPAVVRVSLPTAGNAVWPVVVMLAAYGAPGLIALLAGAGLYSGEVERDTTPLLLGLPLSRTRIWLAKLLAGLTLGVLATGAVVLLFLAADSGMPRYPGLGMAPEMVGWWLVLFALAALWSALSARTVSSLLAALGTFTLAAVGTAYLMVGGSSLVGQDAVDFVLWLVVLVPGAVVASWVGLQRGELLRTRARMLPALVVFVVSGVVILAAIVGGMRSTLTYQRGEAGKLEQVALGGGGRVISTQYGASPVWRTYRAASRTRLPYYRVKRTLVLGETGQELVVAPEHGVVAVSPDGRRAAVISPQSPITWRRNDPVPARHLAVWNLAQRRVIYRASPELLRGAGATAAAWSPDGRRLAVVGAGALVVLPIPGGQAHYPALALGMYPGWAWHPSGDSLLVLDQRQGLVRYDLASHQVVRLIPSLAHAEPRQPGLLPVLEARSVVVPSPDGRWVALGWQEGRRWQGGATTWNGGYELLVAAADGSGHRRLAAALPPGELLALWWWQGRVVAAYQAADGFIGAWDPATGKHTRFPVPGEVLTSMQKAVPAASGDRLLVGCVMDLWLVRVPSGESRLLLGGDREVPVAVEPVGFDRRGRAVYRQSRDPYSGLGPMEIRAIPLTGGQGERVYP